MLRVDFEKWDQTISDLRRLSVNSSHPRTRERFLALYEIAQGSNATKVAKASERDDETVQTWVKRYNSDGPDAVAYRHTGGRSPLLTIANAVSFETS